MSKTSKPNEPTTAPPQGAKPAGPTSGRWPTPPFGCYPKAGSPAPGTPCEVVLKGGEQQTGRLVFFVPNTQLVHVQIMPARTSSALRFEELQSLTLMKPLEPIAPEAGAPAPAEAADWLSAHRPVNAYRVTLASGAQLRGDTVGHVESEHGLFLFPPLGTEGAVLRLFVPRVAYTGFEIGARIGAVLIEQNAATEAQVETAAREQHELRTRRLGDILVAQQVVTAPELLVALERQSTMPAVRLGEALISLGLIQHDLLDDALEQQRSDRNVPLGELLVRNGAISRRDLQTALARKMGYPLVDLTQFPCEIEALRSLAFPIAHRLQAMPLLLRAGRLMVALEDPTRRALVDEIEFATQLKVVPVLAALGSVAASLATAYERAGLSVADVQTSPAPEFTPDDTDELMASLEREGQELPGGAEEHQIEQSDNSLVRLINTMIIEAAAQGVSDIHIESYPGREKIKIRFRKDGVLEPHLELPHTFRNALIARIKIMCDLDIAERRKPQDGKINFAKFSPTHKLELRVASIPTNGGLEDVVMRILASAKPIPLVKLGLAPRNLEWIKTLSQRPYGLILCVGPTGSGKTTTLHSVLSHINVPQRKIWTAEDPVEITQAGLRQVQINPKIDWTFARALRAFLRADPDVIMVGEIRDEETAEMAVEASLTGHLVMSTLHTNSAPETVTRLLDMGMDPFNFADSLLMVLAQRLVRRLCSECRSSEPATDKQIAELAADYLNGCPKNDERFTPEALRAEWLERFGQDGTLMRYSCAGCAKCGQSGLRGRAGLHELMAMTPELREQIQGGSRAAELQRTALLGGMRTLRQDGIEKVLQGITSIDEVRAMSNA